ncbi:MAG: hypothetical protein RL227_469 [Pseudomonadota bacterium]|jgi:hypothetical protein
MPPLQLGLAILTPFTALDTDGLLAVRNHDTVRPYMPDPAPLAPETHARYVHRHLLQGGATLVWLARAEGVPIGFGLLRRLNPAAVELGVMVVAAHQRSLLPARIAVALTALASRSLGASELVTYANARHTLALRLNRGFGLLQAPSDKPGEHCFRTPIDLALDGPLSRRLTRDLPAEWLLWRPLLGGEESQCAVVTP